VDPATVEEYLRANRARDPACIPGIQLDVDRMLRFWKDNLPIIKATNFPEAAQPAKRFHFNNGSYPYGDAIMLRTMMMRLQPRRIIEIGSGYTTACMLDTAEDARLKDLQVTCIEPYADRLRRLLRPTDWARVSLIEKPVQCLPPETFDQLASGDILFIDSTHVLKTGSDVHYELFYILPRIRPGVVIHVHDVPYPFEYPDEWVIKQNLSWNEAYMLQAFLMFNNSFEVLMWNSLLSRMHRAELATDYPLFLKNPGSSLWMTRRPAS
jgi:predicted O-methyltransferase YrrM